MSTVSAFSTGFATGFGGGTYVGAEDVVITDWLDTVLKADAVVSSMCEHVDGSIKVFADLAPAYDNEGGLYGYPFVVYQVQTSADVFGGIVTS